MDQYSLEDSAELIVLRSAWERVIDRFRHELPVASFERFIRPLNPISYRDGSVVVAVPSKFILDWVRGRHFHTLQSWVSDELGEEVRLELTPVPRENLRPGPGLTTVVPTAVAPPQNAFRPCERFSFDNFVVGQSNRLAFAGARAISTEPGTKYNPLFIYGSSGLGKTHLLHAIASEIMRTQPGLSLVYISAQQFAEEFVTALQNNRIDQFRRAQRSVSVWLVDDIQFVAGKDKTQEEIFHTFNYLHSLGKQIVLSSDRPPRDLYLMDERLRSRFESGLVADIQMPDTETRCAILLSKAAQEGIDLSMEVAMLLAEKVPGNIRILEGALTKLAVQASLIGIPITLELAAEQIEQYYRAGSLAKPGVERIVEVVGKHLKISPDEITGQSRKAPIVHARHVAVYITRTITGDSWKHIGSQFGNRDHTSMMHGYQKVSELVHRDKHLHEHVKSMIHELYPQA
jgi:chromosomal replication initiator protein